MFRLKNNSAEVWVSLRDFQGKQYVDIREHFLLAEDRQWQPTGKGIMILPAVISRFWSRDLTAMTMSAVAAGIVSGYCGLLLSYHAGLPAGPAIILFACVVDCGSVLFGRCGGLLRGLVSRRHLEA